MLRNEIILVNTSSPLRNYMKRRPTHYAEILARENRVINISWAPIKNLFRRRNSTFWEEKILFRIPGSGFKLLNKLNNQLYKSFLKQFINTLPQKPILWHFFSGNYEAVKSLPCKISILEICDDTPEFFSNNLTKYNEVKKNEDNMARTADIVFTISDYLKQKRKKIRPDIYLIRNGVAYEDFARVPKLLKKETDALFNLGSPIVGYFGAISQWFDFDLVEALINRLRSINFVFVGRISPQLKSRVEKLNSKPNVHFLGEKQYNELPHLMKYCDLCQIPFVINELILSVNPIKLYEYLAAGKRVVSNPLPEVLFYRKEGIVETASNIEEYAMVIERMLTKNAKDFIESCQKIARENTWESRVESACEIIKQKINRLA